VCCSVLQRVAVCCRVLQSLINHRCVCVCVCVLCVSVFYCVCLCVQCVLQCAATCCRVLPCAAIFNQPSFLANIWTTLFKQETCKDKLPASKCTRLRRVIGYPIFPGHFRQKGPITSGSFAKNDLQLKVSYGFSPLCINIPRICRKNPMKWIVSCHWITGFTVTLLGLP